MCIHISYTCFMLQLIRVYEEREIPNYVATAIAIALAMSWNQYNPKSIAMKFQLEKTKLGHSHQLYC